MLLIFSQVFFNLAFLERIQEEILLGIGSNFLARHLENHAALVLLPSHSPHSSRLLALPHLPWQWGDPGRHP